MEHRYTEKYHSIVIGFIMKESVWLLGEKYHVTYKGKEIR